MFVWDWVWGIQHWQKSLSLALSQSLCGVHSSIISNTLEYTTDKSGQKSLTFNKQSTIASPETSTHKSCCHSYAIVVPSQAYSPFIVAKLHVNGKANCTLAQRHQKDNSICPTSSGELKPIQATQTSDFPSLPQASEPPIVLLKFSITWTETKCLWCHSLLPPTALLGIHPQSIFVTGLSRL